MAAVGTCAWVRDNALGPPIARRERAVRAAGAAADADAAAHIAIVRSACIADLAVDRSACVCVKNAAFRLAVDARPCQRALVGCQKRAQIR
jgi:hypothetical protein